MSISRNAWWLIGCNTIYVLVAFYDVTVYNSMHLVWIQMLWVIIMSTPLWIKPLKSYIFNK